MRAGGSLNHGFSYGDARAGATTLALVPSPITGEPNKEPHGVFGGGFTFLEHYILHKGIVGDSRSLREALFAYLRVWGVKC